MSTSSSVRALSSSDLVDSIAEHLAKPDLVRLARTSKLCFESTIHLVWAEVHGIHNLLRLVPGVKCSKRSDGYWQITIPDLESSDRTRFHLHAAHVFRLCIFPKDQTFKYRIADWEHFLEYGKSRVLLPNLRTIISERYCRDRNFIRWIAALLSPKIVVLHTHSVKRSFTSWMSMPSASSVLKLISERSPGIEKLSIFPIDNTDVRSYGHGSLDLEPYIRHYPQTGTNDRDDRHEARLPLYYEYIKKLTGLQYLATTWLIFNSEGLEVLASLPHLKKILLEYNHPNTPIDYRISPRYAGNPFPSLRSLVLILPSEAHVRRLWSLSQLVHRLTEVEVLSPPDRNRDPNYQNIVSLIPLICKRSPAIEKLRIDFDVGTRGFKTIETEIVICFAALPLKTLDLRYVELEDVPGACRILAQCNGLREIRLQDQSLSFSQLIHFTQIPRLELFHANIKWPDAQKMIELTGSGLPSLSNIRILQCSHAPPIGRGSRDKRILNAARFFLVCFPKIEHVSYVETSAYGHIYGYAGRTCAILTDVIRNMQKASVSGSSSKQVKV